jgi:hypothetical protein
MLAGSILLLSGVLASTPVAETKLASSWADATCGDDGASSVAPVVLQCEADVDCQPAPVAPAAVLDCNQVSSQPWVGKMIGSCDMPRPTEGPSLEARRPNGRGCTRLECSDSDASTFTTATIGADQPPIALFASALPLTLDASPLPFPVATAWISIPATRLERPPRA